MRSHCKRRCDGGPPAEPLPNSDDPRVARDHAADTLAQVSPLALIGRQGARQSFWDATAALATAWWSQPASLATTRRPEPLYVFGAAGAPSDNRKTEPRDALNASSLARLTDARCARYLLTEVKKVEENRGAPIDYSGHLRVWHDPSLADKRGDYGCFSFHGFAVWICRDELSRR
jgi:hypothetical protein